MSQDRIDGSLMRVYVEKKIPLAESRLLANLATMLAESWAIGYEAKNIALMGVVSRMLFFVEQSAIDGGRMQMGYLLGGFPEPAMHLLSQRRLSSLAPFAKLCNPAWISANLAYLKDLDYIESRTQQLGKTDPKLKGTEEQEDKALKVKPRPKPPKGGGKKGGKGCRQCGTNQCRQLMSSPASEGVFRAKQAAMGVQSHQLNRGALDQHEASMDPLGEPSNLDDVDSCISQIDQVDLSRTSCRVFNVSNLVHVLCKSFRGSHSCLQSFTHSSLSVRHSCAIEEGPSSSIWPVPPPRWCWTGSKRLSPKHRRRKAYFAARHELLSLVVCVLNWQLLGFPRAPPSSAVCGAPISVQQHEVLERLELFFFFKSLAASDL